MTLTDATTFVADLTPFENVYCFPTSNEWSQVSVDSYGRGLVWPSRFEVHIDQICHYVDSIQQKSTS